jgi:hypothetical protein
LDFDGQLPIGLADPLDRYLKATGGVLAGGNRNHQVLGKVDSRPFSNTELGPELGPRIGVTDD